MLCFLICNDTWYTKFSDPISFSASLVQAFEVLSKRLRLIEDIPLKVSGVQPLDSGTDSRLET